METSQSGVSVQDALFTTASSDAENFATTFRKIRKMFPTEVTQACIFYLAQKGLDPAGQKMALWLAAEVRYFKTMFEGGLPVDVVVKATPALVKSDPQFLSKFLKEADLLTLAPQILRALSMVPATGDRSPLLPWLKKLSQYPEDRVRSRAVKLLCERRSTKNEIARQMLDENPRVRANAIEGLWNSKSADATELFKVAMSDSNHRVVGNALIGLHLQGNPEGFAKIAELCESPQIPVRRAMAWCLGHIQDERGIPLLQTLAKDPAPVVRNRALRSLLALQPAETVAA